MKLENQFIDIDFAPVKKMIYCGYCIKQSNQLIILMNFNSRSKQFDGFTVFRPKDITRYRYWSKSEIKEIKKDNRSDLLSLLDVKKMKSFYSCLKYIDNNILVAIYTNNNIDEYFVAKVIKLNRNSVKLKLINQNSQWKGSVKLLLSDIDFFGFLTKYEILLLKKAIVV